MGIDPLTEAGYVIVATDYVGLGTEGQSSVPDRIQRGAVGARCRSCSPADRGRACGPSFCRVGALAKAGTPGAVHRHPSCQLTRRELKLVGVAAAAPATNLAELFKADRKSEGGRSLTSMAVYSWTRVFGLPLGGSSISGPSANSRLWRTIASRPSRTSFKRAGREGAREEVPQSRSGDISTREAHHGCQLAGHAAARHAGLHCARNGGRSRAARDHEGLCVVLCRGGARVKMYTMPGGGHMWAGRDSAGAAVEWIGRRFKGKKRRTIAEGRGGWSFCSRSEGRACARCPSGSPRGFHPCARRGSGSAIATGLAAHADATARTAAGLPMRSASSE